MKAVGAGHSFTSIACTDGVMVDLWLRRVLDHDVAAGRVTVEGHQLHRLSDELDARGLALENMGDIDQQSDGRRHPDRHARDRPALRQPLGADRRPAPGAG